MNIKKIIVTALCLALCFSMVLVPFSTFAAAAPMELEIYGTSSVKAEEPFTLTVRNKRQISLAGFYAVLNYSSRDFSASKVTFLNKEMSAGADYGFVNAGSVVLTWDSDSDIVLPAGDLIKIQFVTRSQTETGDKKFVLSDFEVYNQAFENLKPKSNPECTVKIDAVSISESVRNTIELINAIGIVDASTASYNAIHKALDSYNALSAAEKKQVENYEVLKNALAEYEKKREEQLKKEHDEQIAATLLGLRNDWKPYFDTSGVIKDDLMGSFSYDAFLKAQLPFDPTTQDIPEDWEPNYEKALSDYEALLDLKIQGTKNAVDSYKSQSNYIKSQLITEKASLDSAISALRAAKQDLLSYKQQLKSTPQTVKDYLTNNNSALNFPKSNLKLDETEAVPNMLLSAIGEYKTLNDIAKAQLVDKYNYVCELHDEYLRLEAKANPNEEQAVIAAGEFRKKYSDLLILSPSEVDSSRLLVINAAIAEFNSLPTAVKGRLTTQFKLLCEQLYALTNIRAELDGNNQVIYITKDGEIQKQPSTPDTADSVTTDNKTAQVKPSSIKISDLKTSSVVYILLIFIGFETLVIISSLISFRYIQKKKGDDRLYEV